MSYKLFLIICSRAVLSGEKRFLPDRSSRLSGVVQNQRSVQRSILSRRCNLAKINLKCHELFYCFYRKYFSSSESVTSFSNQCYCHGRTGLPNFCDPIQPFQNVLYGRLQLGTHFMNHQVSGTGSKSDSQLHIKCLQLYTRPPKFDSGMILLAVSASNNMEWLSSPEAKALDALSSLEEKLDAHVALIPSSEQSFLKAESPLEQAK